MSFRSLRLPALMAGAAAAAVSFATPSFAWYSHARHHYRTTHHVVVHEAAYRPEPSYAWVPGAVIMTILGGVEVNAPDIIGRTGVLAGDDCAYGYPIAANGRPYCPPYGYYAPGSGYPGPR